MKTFKNNDQILSILYRDSDWVEGLNFITPNEMFIQAGSWWYNKGKVLARHVHKDFERLAIRTQEAVYIKTGSMRVDLYSDNLEYLESFVMHEGDLAVFAYGGHGYEILEDGTKVIETKNGPFVDVDTDKNKF